MSEKKFNTELHCFCSKSYGKPKNLIKHDIMCIVNCGDQ